MKLSLLLLAPLVLPACSNQPVGVADAQTPNEPVTTVYVSAHTPEQASEKPVIEASQPDPGPLETSQSHHRPPAKHPLAKAKSHAVFHTEHGSFHSVTPD